MKSSELAIYRDLLGEIKTRVRQAQHRAVISANAEMILMYWDIGRMIAFYREYPFLPRPVAEIGARTAPQLQNSQSQETVILQQVVAKISMPHESKLRLQKTDAQGGRAVPALAQRRDAVATLQAQAFWKALNAVFPNFSVQRWTFSVKRLTLKSLSGAA
jgi:hypothetical protein